MKRPRVPPITEICVIVFVLASFVIWSKDEEDADDEEEEEKEEE